MTGGHLNDWYKLFPDRRDSKEVKGYLDKKVSTKGLKVITGATVEKISTKRNFISVFTDDGKEMTADAVVVATGFDLFKSERKEEYGYGIYDNVITSADLEIMFRKGQYFISKRENTNYNRICPLCWIDATRKQVICIVRNFVV